MKMADALDPLLVDSKAAQLAAMRAAVMVASMVGKTVDQMAVLWVVWMVSRRVGQ